MSKVSFIKSDDRRYNIERCLSLIKSEIISGLKEARNVVVKPDCPTDSIKLAATHAEAIDAVLDFIKPYTQGQITLAEGVGAGDTLTAFKNFGYLELQEKYDFTIVDLNSYNYDAVLLIDERGRTWHSKIAKTILNSDYLISVAPPKTHDSIAYAGAIKNVAVGSLVRSIPTFSKPINKLKASLGLLRNNKALIHQGQKAINENIIRIFERVPLKLTILDAFETMEGDGPLNGDMVPAHWSVASTDPIAADWLACQLMGIDVSGVGYLSLLNAEDNNHFIVGDDWKKSVIKFKMHSKVNKGREPWNAS